MKTRSIQSNFNGWTVGAIGTIPFFFVAGSIMVMQHYKPFPDSFVKDLECDASSIGKYVAGNIMGVLPQCASPV